MLSAAALAAGCAFAAVAFKRRTGSWAHPVVVYYLLWSGVVAFNVFNPLHLAPLSSRAVELIAAGLAAVAVGSWIGLTTERRESPAGGDGYGIDTGRLVLATIVIGAVVGFGVLRVVGGVESAAGRPFESLSAQEIRYVSVEGSARRIGLGNLAYQITPVLAGLGLLLARIHRGGWLVVIVAVAATALLPGRLFTLTTLALLVLFAYYTRMGRQARRQSLGSKRRRTALAVAVLAAVAGLGIGYFAYQGERLGKQEYFASRVPDSFVPDAVVPFVVYMTASPVTFASALDNSFEPVADHRYRSVWLLARLAALVRPDVRVPETIAGFVPIPFQFNTYTWVADVYWDFGVIGVLLIGFAMGLLVARTHDLARGRSGLAASWLAACVAVFFLSSIVEFRFMWLEAVVLPAVGAMALYFVTRPSQRT